MSVARWQMQGMKKGRKSQCPNRWPQPRYLNSGESGVSQPLWTMWVSDWSVIMDFWWNLLLCICSMIGLAGHCASLRWFHLHGSSTIWNLDHTWLTDEKAGMGFFSHTSMVTSKQQLTGLGRGKGTWMVLICKTLGSFLFWHSLPSHPTLWTVSQDCKKSHGVGFGYMYSLTWQAV